MLLSIYAFSCQADVVKPALIEIIAHTDGRIHIEVRASIEALLTGINSQYKNTQEAPNAKAYDTLRILPPEALRKKFATFEKNFLASLWLKTQDTPVTLRIDQVVVPEVGYPKVPRISVIHLRGELSPHSQQLRWFYPEKFGNNAVRVKQADEAKQQWHWSNWQWLRNNQASKPFSLEALFQPEPLWQTIVTYIELGISHIVPKGTDHILFILGIFLLSQKSKPLLWQVTMFTVAHTLTLGLAMYGWVNIPARIVEPLIALSIAYIALENIFSQTLHKHRLALVFGFGLLHGLGFASVLTDLGMPSHAFVTALISFNVGVEVGQLLVLGLAFAAIGIWFGAKPWYRQRISTPTSLLIAVIGIYWALERALII